MEKELVEVRWGSVSEVFVCDVVETSAFRIGDLVSVERKTNSIQVLQKTASTQLPKEINFDTLKKWNWFIKEVREFFYQKDFLELKTPLLVTSPGSEPSLDIFATELLHGHKKKQMFLPTSPELHLKKALVKGAERIYEITSSFRNNEITERHQPEFFILEWYRAFSNLNQIKKDCEQLVHHLVLEKMKKYGGSSALLDIELPKAGSISVADLFKQHLGFELRPETNLEDLKKLAELKQVDVHAASSIDDFFFLIFMDKIEHRWSRDEILFVEKYPPYQAALARMTEDGWGDRFEMYWQGYEIANAFFELNDVEIQKQRFAEDNEKKIHLGKQPVPIDEDFIEHLEMGMPPSAGIALGLDRLFMALFGIEDIRSVHSFPYKGSGI